MDLVKLIYVAYMRGAINNFAFLNVVRFLIRS